MPSTGRKGDVKGLVRRFFDRVFHCVARDPQLGRVKLLESRIGFPLRQKINPTHRALQVGNFRDGRVRRNRDAFVPIVRDTIGYRMGMSPGIGIHLARLARLEDRTTCRSSDRQYDANCYGAAMIPQVVETAMRKLTAVS